MNPTIFEKVQKKVIDQMNALLMAPYTDDDNDRVVFSIGDLKAPRQMGSMQFSFKSFFMC